MILAGLSSNPREAGSHVFRLANGYVEKTRYGEAGMLRRYFQEGCEAASEAGEGQKHQRQTKLIEKSRMFRGPCLTCKAGNLRGIWGALLLFLHPSPVFCPPFPACFKACTFICYDLCVLETFRKGCIHILDFHVWAWFLSRHSLYKDACGCIIWFLNVTASGAYLCDAPAGLARRWWSISSVQGMASCGGLP